MSRLQRVKDAISSTVTKLRSQVEASYSAGKIPADYSLGFANGVIFCDHHINLRDGDPTFFDRKGSIGTLPIPVALRTPEEQEREFKTPEARAAEKQLEDIKEEVIEQAVAVIDTMDRMAKEDPTEHVNERLAKEFSEGLSRLRNSVLELCEFGLEDEPKGSGGIPT